MVQVRTRDALAFQALVAVIQEERLQGTKNVAGFPHLAVREVLRIAGWKAGANMKPMPTEPTMESKGMTL